MHKIRTRQSVGRIEDRPPIRGGKTRTGTNELVKSLMNSSFAIRPFLGFITGNIMNRHTQEKNLKCQHCEKSFKDMCSRRRHEMAHTGENPYQCQYCEKKCITIIHSPLMPIPLSSETMPMCMK